jgi:hypothetical protein
MIYPQGRARGRAKKPSSSSAVPRSERNFQLSNRHAPDRGRRRRLRGVTRIFATININDAKSGANLSPNKKSPPAWGRKAVGAHPVRIIKQFLAETGLLRNHNVPPPNSLPGRSAFVILSGAVKRYISSKSWHAHAKYLQGRVASNLRKGPCFVTMRMDRSDHSKFT